MNQELIITVVAVVLAIWLLLKVSKFFIRVVILGALALGLFILFQDKI